MGLKEEGGDKVRTALGLVVQQGLDSAPGGERGESKWLVWEFEERATQSMV